MLLHIGKNWEFSIDHNQWAIGFNYYPKGTLFDEAVFNIFLGPIRLGWWAGGEKFWSGVNK